MSDVRINLDEHLKGNLLEVVHYFAFHFEDLWNLSERGFLFRLFQSCGSSGTHLELFSDNVNQVIEQRRKLSNTGCRPKSVRGKLLLFDPSATMYDGVSEGVTEGFFDSDDVPPPEFWIGMSGDKLAAFIPSSFGSQANKGIENCMSGCLEWITDELEISL